MGISVKYSNYIGFTQVMGHLMGISQGLMQVRKGSITKLGNQTTNNMISGGCLRARYPFLSSQVNHHFPQ